MASQGCTSTRLEGNPTRTEHAGKAFRLDRGILHLKAVQAPDAVLQPGSVGGWFVLPGMRRVDHQRGEIARGVAAQRHQREVGDDGNGKNLERKGDQRDHQRGASEQGARCHHDRRAPPGEKR
jgi:hypothetical protein